MMTPEQSINQIWPSGNPNINRARVATCVAKIEVILDKHGFTAACHGSYSHAAMIIVADERGLDVEHNRATDIVVLIEQ